MNLEMKFLHCLDLSNKLKVLNLTSTATISSLLMNEAETRAELIDPKLKACGWGVVEGSKILREYNITAGKIQTGGVRAKKLTADYVLVYKGIKLAVVEAKSDDLGVGEGVAQAKQYAEKLKLETTYSTNGKEIYSICMKTGAEGLVADYLTPEQLWNKTFAVQNEWRENFLPFRLKIKAELGNCDIIRKLR
jgi:type I restriction enzyme R subunit